MKTQEVADLDGGSTLAEIYSMADSYTTAGCIPILFLGGFWAHRHVHAGIRLIPTPLILMKVPCAEELLGGGVPRALGSHMCDACISS